MIIICNKIAQQEEFINKLKQQISLLEKDINEMQAQLNEKMLEVNQENRLRKAAELAKETALTNLKNAYALMNSNETARHETNLEIEKVTNSLEAKVHECDELRRQCQDFQNKFDISQMQLTSEQAKNSKLETEIEQLKANFEDLKNNSVLKSDVIAQTEKSRIEKAKLIAELKEIQQQYNIQVSDNETKEITLKHQEEILKANADKVAEYKSGKDKLFGFFVGQVMKESKGANPARVNELLKEKLS